jgi:predicted esterase
MKKNMKILLLGFSLILLSGCASNQSVKSSSFKFETKELEVNGNYTEEVITLITRTGIKQRFILSKPSNSTKGIIILFTGGNGKLFLHQDEDQWKVGNFLVRSRGIFASNDYVIATIDSPSKRKNGMKDGFRTSPEHIKDIKAVIKYLKNKYPNQKVYLIGTSRGTESVAHLAINLKNKIDGIILTSTVTNSKKYKRGTTVLDMNLDEITVPTLIVSHKNDGCKVTPSSQSPEIYNTLNEKVAKKLVYVSGGYEESINLCKAKTHHGFLGIENDVVNLIITFIDQN